MGHRRGTTGVRARTCLLALACAWAGAAAACPAAGGQTATIAAVEPRLELRLADGRLLRLAGLDPALATPTSPDGGDVARQTFAEGLVGRAVTLQVLAAAPDRWGRWPALVSLSGKDDAAGLAARAIAAGLGRYRAEPDAHACRDALRDAEARARAAKAGLWADPYYAVRTVDDRAGFLETAGTDIVAEGVLARIETSRFRTTLRFAAPVSDTGRGTSGNSYAGHMLVATILPRVMKSFEAQSMDPRTLVGRRLRFRGLLDLRFGPRVELAGPDAVELLPAAAR